MTYDPERQRQDLENKMLPMARQFLDLLEDGISRMREKLDEAEDSSDPAPESFHEFGIWMEKLGHGALMSGTGFHQFCHIKEAHEYLEQRGIPLNPEPQDPMKHIIKNAIKFDTTGGDDDQPQGTQGR